MTERDHQQDSHDERIRRYAELAVRVGANVGEDQYVAVDGLVEHHEFVRALANAAYLAGARFVDVRYADLHVKRAMLKDGPEAALTFTPLWLVKRLEQLGSDNGALILVAGNPEPELFSDLDVERVGRARQVAFDKAHMRNISTRAVNWTIAAYPNRGWAETIYGEPDIERLWRELAHVVRLDESDPVAAWTEHIDRLEHRARTLNDAACDAIRFVGPGTDLTIGLLHGSRWRSAAAQTTFGRRHVVNLPTEEVYTTPDRTRADGVVRATAELLLPGGIVRGLELRFEDGRIVGVEAEAGVDYVGAQIAADEGASRLGEVALVDATSRVGAIGHVFANGLLDENAASHLAYGSGFPYCVEGVDPNDPEAQTAAGVNQSSIHTDVMIGGSHVDVFGLSADGDQRPIIVRNEWRLS